MNKATKLMTAAAMVALMASAPIFAQSASRRAPSPVPVESAVTDTAKEKSNKAMGMKGFTNETVIIGTVRYSNFYNNTINVLNTDSKDIQVKISPFTKIMIDYNNQSPVSADFNDIKNGDNIFITTFKTGTKLSDAALIIIKRTVSNNNANAK